MNQWNRLGVAEDGPWSSSLHSRRRNDAELRSGSRRRLVGGESAACSHPQRRCFLIHLSSAVFSLQLQPPIKKREKIRKHSYYARRTFHKSKTTTSGAIKASDISLYRIMHCISCVEQTEALEGCDACLRADCTSAQQSGSFQPSFCLFVLAVMVEGRRRCRSARPEVKGHLKDTSADELW